jgi:photosynthetic reaction center H subunit
MESGDITQSMDVAQITLYVFWIFFFGLVIYLRRQDLKPGFDSVGHHESAANAPHCRPNDPFPQAPVVAVGNPLLAGIGPGAWPIRSDTPELAFDDQKPRVVPMRTEKDFSIAHEDADPRGYAVYGADGEIGGTITDLWIDRSEHAVRYFEMEVPVKSGTKRLLVPNLFVDSIKAGKRSAFISAILSTQFADIPATKKPQQVSTTEEERIVAYFAAGRLFATPQRAEPLI